MQIGFADDTADNKPEFNIFISCIFNGVITVQYKEKNKICIVYFSFVINYCFK